MSTKRSATGVYLSMMRGKKEKKTVLTWSSPIRRAGCTTLSPIPNEIYLRIFDYIQPAETFNYTRVLSDLALVCRFFCFTILPRIYKKLELVGSAHTDSTPNYSAFCRAVVKDAEPARTLAKHVRECAFRGWTCSDDHLTWSYNAFLGLYCNALGMMSGIETVHLHSTPISRTMLRTIRGLKRLKVLSIFSCTFQNDVTEKDIAKLSSLRLVEFRLSMLLEHAGTLKARALMKAIDLSNLQSIQTDMWDLVSRLVDEMGTIPLCFLDIFFLQDWALFQKILKKTPFLSFLKILHLTDLSFINSDLKIDSSLIPTLQNLTCPPDLVSTFVPGRPITVLKILTSRQVVMRGLQLADIKLMTKSSVMIHELSISATAYFTFSVWEHLPALKKLELYRTNKFLLEDVDLVLRTFADQPADPKHPPGIREVTFSVSPSVPHLNFFNLPCQHEIISTVMAGRFPELEKVLISKYIEWRRSDGDGWSPSIAITHSTLLAGKIKTGEFTYFDHGGCIERLLNVVFGSQAQT